jgi:hypothetical protein
MEPNMTSVLALNGAGSELAAPTTTTTQRFQALMQQNYGASPATEQPSPTSGGNHWQRFKTDTYVDDEVAGVASGHRAVELSPELTAFGQRMSNNLRLSLSTARLEQMKLDNHPHADYLRRGILDALEVQRGFMEFGITMKAVELTVRGAQGLFKMQG